MIYRTKDGDVLDAICYKYYGKQSPAVEYVLAWPANAHLADLGAVYESGVLIELPELPDSLTKPLQQVPVFEHFI